MARSDNNEGVQTVYGALMGGLIASMLGILVFGLFLNSTGAVGDRAPLLAMFAGMACVIVLMFAGAYFDGRSAWLTHTMLYASGFTAMWTAALSIGAEPRWAAASGYVLMIGLGLGLGAWRFRNKTGVAEVTGNEVTWTH
ncbi:MAG TPA: hypothetical protein VFG89_09610 [Coriobacteriia bacterium]|nr:hypothetical protein [Coriobacteriia bacterium]